ncbi:MAG: helix-turn-helix transcriptional regulator [Deltaproteobacteria bacterium]|nr:helix-turn-helix transcriptional regulator [Deltaproteobacteria bacterium]
MRTAISLSTTDLEELFVEAGRQLDVPLSRTSDEFVLSMPERLGKGSFRAIELREGLSLFFLDYYLDVDLRLLTQRDHSLWGSTFCLAGQFSCTARGLKDELQFRAGSQNVFVGSTSGSVTLIPKAQPVHLVGMHVAPQWLQSLLTDESPMPLALQRALQNSTQDLPYSYSDNVTAAMQVALQHLLHCPYHGPLKQLCLESKTLELLVLQLADVPRDPAPSLHASLRPQDVDRIYCARDILLRNLSQPPSLLTLARQVGVNDFKLKRGFRQVFGTSVFAYLHEHRMQQARTLLTQGDLSVKQVASTIGYASLGHFTAAFKKRFRTTPGVVSRTR